MKKVLATGSGTRAAVVLIIISLAVVLLAASLVARAGGGDSTDRPQLSPAHGLPDRACARGTHPPRFDKVTRALPSYRSHAVAQPRCDRHRQSGSGHRHRESTASLVTRINTLAKDRSPRGRGALATVINQLPKDQRFYDAAPKHLALLSKC